MHGLRSMCLEGWIFTDSSQRVLTLLEPHYLVPFLATTYLELELSCI